MRTRLMDAAAACLEEKGYAGFSITDVVQRAGVTRGALFHHFSSRAELIAEVAWWSAKASSNEAREELMAAMAAGATLEEQMRVLWRSFRKRGTIENEYRTARRADPELAKAAEAAIVRNQDVEPRYNTVPLAWTTVPGDPTPELSRFIVGYFLTGMQVLEPFNAPELPEQALVKFASLLELAFAAMKRGETGDDVGDRTDR